MFCNRVEDPANCENKQCVLWRNWFLSRWNQTRKLFGMESGQSDPCLDCVWKGPLCSASCPTRKAYEKEEKP